MSSQQITPLTAKEFRTAAAALFLMAALAVAAPATGPEPTPGTGRFAEAANSVNSERNSLVIDWPQPRMVTQRASSNLGTVAIQGRCAPMSRRVEARLVPRGTAQGRATDWKVLDTFPEEGTFSGFITAGGGWYDLETRTSENNPPSAGATVERVGIGEVFLIAGHSVAAGQDENMEAAADDRVVTIPLDKQSSAFQSYLQTGEARFLPPLRFVHFGTGVVPAPFGHGPYFWSKLGEELARRYNVPVLILNAAFGGTSLEHWAKSARGIQFEHGFVKASIRMPYINLANALRKYIPLTGLRAILADQGQNDWPERDEEAVYQNYLAWVAQARADLRYPELAVVVNRQTPFLRDTLIRKVQERVIRTPNCFPGPDYDTLSKEARPDAIHLGPRGQTEAARLWAEALDDRFFRESKPYPPSLKARPDQNRTSK